MKKIRKAVFPVAGLGTRFLPATKSIPKEMLTVVDRPVLQHELSRRVILKYTPQLHFHLDEAVERGTKVMEILRQIDDTVPPPDEDADARMDEEEPVGNSEELARFEEEEDEAGAEKPRRAAMEADPTKPRGRRAEDAARLKDEDDD